MRTSPRASAPFPLLILAAGLAACGPTVPPGPPEESITVPSEGTVIVYVEAPHYLAGPILKLFSEQTGIKVVAKYREEVGDGFLDLVRSEATAGRADLFWGRSPLGAVALARAGLLVPFRPAGARPVPPQYRDQDFRWIGFAANPRVILFNEKLVPRDRAPQSIDDLTGGPWSGKAAMARIADGPAGFWAAALASLWGDAKAREFLAGIASAGNRVVADDSEVRRAVAAGDSAWGFIDLDRAICAKREGEAVSIFFPDRMGLGAVMIPQVEGLLRGAPHPAQARGLAAYFFSTETAWQVGQNDCALMSLLPVVALGIPKPDWVPILGAVNVTRVDNDAVYDAWTRQRSSFDAWGRAAPSR